MSSSWTDLGPAGPHPGRAGSARGNRCGSIERVLYVEFVSARYASLYRTAYLLTGNHHTAEDLVQTVLTKVYVSWGRVRRTERPESYARRMLANEAVSLHRHRWTA